MGKIGDAWHGGEEVSADATQKILSHNSDINDVVAQDNGGDGGI